MNRQRGIFSPVVAIIILIILGVLIYQFRQKSQEVVVTLKTSPSPTTSSLAGATQIPTESPSGSPSGSPSSLVKDTTVPLELPVALEANCVKDHEGLGNHLDLWMAIGNLESLGSKDFLIATKDTKDNDQALSSPTPRNKYAGMTIKSADWSNQTWVLHKYIPANQAPYQPLEMIADGRVFEVTVYKAQYQSDGSIEVYIEVGKTNFSKKCEF